MLLRNKYPLRGAPLMCLLALLGLLSGCATRDIQRTQSVGTAVSTHESDMQLAQASLTGGNFNSAIRIYKDKLAADPNDFDLQMRLAETLVEANALDEAATAFKRACKLRDWSSKPFSGLARVALRQGRPRQAFNFFLMAASRDPNSRIALNGMAVSKDYLGLHKEAQEIYRSLLLKNPEDLKVKSNLGLSMALEGQYDRSINYLLSFASSPSAPAQARHNLAIAYALAGELPISEKIQAMDLPASSVKKNINYLSIVSRVMRCEERSSCAFSAAR